jgi:hypothetical protein
MQMVTIDELDHRVKLLEVASQRFDRIDAIQQQHTTQLTMLQQDVGGLRNDLTGLRAHIDAKFHAAAETMETIVKLLKRD